VDSHTEAALWQAIRRTHRGAIVTTSHRRFLLQQADQIVLLANGRVTAIGKLEALLSEQALMRDLWAEMR
jgi:ATP-binding cassette subfamily B protein